MAEPSETLPIPRSSAEWWELKSKALELEVFDAVVAIEVVVFSGRTQGGGEPTLEGVVKEVVAPPCCQTPKR